MKPVPSASMPPTVPSDTPWDTEYASEPGTTKATSPFIVSFESSSKIGARSLTPSGSASPCRKSAKAESP
jgi:hypothetical protein